jgi:ribosomal protein S6--L-glutamate ligase
MTVDKQKIIIGSEEWCALPELGLPAVKMRIDSGAKTSAIHAFNINQHDRNGKKYVSFDIHPIQQNRRITKRCEALMVDKREVKSSSGHVENRYVVKTPIKVGEHVWDIELTLSNRDSMGYRMLLGRQAMKGRILVDPEESFHLGKITATQAESKYEARRMVKSGGLNIILLASNRELYSNRRIMESAKQLGHNIRFINVEHCYINISPGKLGIYYRGGELLENIDAVIPRIKPAVTFYGCAVLRQFAALGAYVLNDSVSIARSRDKLRSIQMLAQKNIRMPVTGFAHSPLDTKELIKNVGGAPLVVKLLEGTQGRGVVLAETGKAAESVINAFKSLKANILVQEFVKEANGRDLRLFVIDGKVVGAMERRAAEGEFRANIHLGGTGSNVKTTPEERKIAIKAAKVMGLDVSGVDIIRSSTGPKVLEVNSSPGLEGIEDVTGKDIAIQMIKCIEKHVK